MTCASVKNRDKLPPRCWRCGRAFDRTFKRASEGENQVIFNNPHDLCLWCHIQFTRDDEIRCDPLNESERESARLIQAFNDARGAGWRIENDRAGPRRRSFIAKVINPDGVIVHRVGDDSTTGSDYTGMLARQYIGRTLLAAQECR